MKTTVAAMRCGEIPGPTPMRLPALPCRRTAAARPAGMLFCLLLVLLFCGCLPPQVHAVDNLFNSGSVIREEFSRLSDEGKLFVAAPADRYLAESAALAGVFALTYVFDRDLKSDQGGARNGTLAGLTDFGSRASNPFLHIGMVAVLYGAGAATESPQVMRLGEELGEALFLADGASFVLKEAIGRGRPNTGDGSSRYRPFSFRDDYQSLPSMHTASSFAIAHVLASKTQSLPVKLLCYAAAGFVGFSRVHQGEHWATDVLLGAAIGELAGDTVTRYHALQKGELTIAPLSIGGTPSLAVMGRF